MRQSVAKSIGVRRLNASGVLSTGASSSTEVFTITDVSSDKFAITEIDGVSLGQFHTIQVTAVGLVATTGSGAHHMLAVVSEDGGSTWKTGASDYVHYRMDAGQTVLDNGDPAFQLTYMQVAETEWTDWMAVFEDFNLAIPTTVWSWTTNTAIATPRKKFGLATNVRTVNNALRFELGGSGVTLEGGTLTVTGYK